MLSKKHIILLISVIILSVSGCLAQKSKRYKGTKGGKVKHHHGFFASNDKATKQNAKFKKKTSKAGNSKKTSSSSAKKSKSRSRPTYVKTFDHH